MEIGTFHPEKIVEYQENRLTCKEIVVQQSHECNCQSKNASAVFVDKLLHCNEHQGEECSNVLKMVEENIVDLES